MKVDKRGKLKVSEADIEKTCTELLELDGWRTIKTDLKFLRGLGVQEKGMADRLYIRYGPSPRDIQRGSTKDNWLPEDCEVMWIEWKSATGKVAAHQKDWHEAERRRGALVLVAGVDFPASIEGFQDWYRSSGLSLGRI